VGSKAFIRYRYADAHLYVQQQHSWKPTCRVHIGYLEELVSHKDEVSRVYVQDVISGREQEQGFLVHRR
jgi:hypothetical protein